MNAAILARTSQLHTNLERVLNCLHDQKSTPVVQEMLQRLYKPILWPALAAPNALVRRNAMSILLSAFPITVRSALPAVLSDSECVYGSVNEYCAVRCHDGQSQNIVNEKRAV